MERQKSNQRDELEYHSDSFSDNADQHDQGSKLKYNSQIILQSEKLNSIFEAGSNQKDNVKVCIRIRPINEREKFSQMGKQFCIQQVDQTTIILDRITDQKTFNFDFVGNDQIDQSTIFNHIAKPIADSCMQGYNGTIFAYGQTGAGKTYTIQGPQIDLNDGTQDQSINSKKQQENYGIIQRSFEYIFQNIQAQQKLVSQNADGSELTYLIKCSYLEIYNEQIMDLLEPSSINLGVREDIKKGVYVEGLREEAVNSYKDMIQLILKGAKNRHVGATSMNRESSRSHSVLTTIIESKSMSQTGVWNMRTSRFHIIDLAGSERSKVTNAVGERLKEAGMINKSLSALGNVINSLVDLSEGKNRHVPYRDSKLTFILRDSLGGNSKTVIIANISPSQMNISETLSTLEFAKRAKQIKNKAIVNEDSSGTILILKNEIKRLKKEMMEQNKNAQKIIQQQISNNQKEQLSEQVCKVCKMNSIIDSAIDNDNTQVGDDSLLLDDEIFIEENENYMKDSDAVRDSVEFRQGLIALKNEKPQNQNQFKKFRLKIYHLHARIKNAEALLQKNIDLVSYQQKYYENEVSDLKDQLVKQTQACESLQQQTSRDIMKMKLREHKIQKLEQDHQINYSDECIQLQSEIKILQEQLIAEREEQHNPKISQLKAQVSELQNQIKKKQIQIIEITQTNESNIDESNQISNQQHQKILSHIQQQQLLDTILPIYMNEQNSLLQNLKTYLYESCNLEQQQITDKKLFQFQIESKQLNSENLNLKNLYEDLQQQYDIRLQQNVEAQEINQKATRELARVNVEFERSQNTLKDQKGEIQSLNQTLLVNSNEFQNQIQNLTELNLSLEKESKSVNENFQNLQNQFDNLKLKYDNELEESQNLKIQIEQQQDQINLKIQVIEQKSDILQEKSTIIQDQKFEIEKLLQKIEKIQQQFESKNIELQAFKQESDLTVKKLEQELSNVMKQQNIQIDEQRHIGENLMIQIEQVNSQKTKILQDKKILQQKVDQMQEENQVISQRLNDLSLNNTDIQSKISDIQLEKEKKENDMKILKKELIKFTENQKKVEETFNKQIEDLLLQKQIQDNNNGLLDQKYKSKIENYKTQIQDLNSQILQGNSKQLEIDLQFKEQIELIISQHNQQIQDYETQVEGLNDQIELLIEEKNNENSDFEDKINKLALKHKSDEQQMLLEFNQKQIQLENKHSSILQDIENKKSSFEKQIQIDQDKLQRELENKQIEINYMIVESEKLKQQYEQQLKTLSDQNQGQQRQILNLSDELEQYHELMDTLNQQEQTKKTLIQNNQEFQNQQMLYKQQIEFLENQITQIKQENLDQINQLEIKYKNQEKQFQADCLNYQEQIDFLQNEIDSQEGIFEDQKQSFESQYTQMQEDHQKKNQEYNISNKSQQEQIEKLKIEISKQVQFHEQEFTNYEQQISQLQQQLKLSEQNINENNMDLQARINEMTIENQQQIKKAGILESQIKEYQNNISYLDVSVEQMNFNLQEKNGHLSHLQGENEELLKQLNIFNNKINDMKEEYQNEKDEIKNQLLQARELAQKQDEEIKAYMELIKKKHEVTQGQEQEQAEQQVLLLEAEKIINDKDFQLQNLQSLQKQYKQQNEALQNEKLQLEKQINQIQQQLEEKINYQQVNELLQLEINKKSMEIQKLEQEKDILQFKRDENVKNLEQKIKDYKTQIKNLEEQCNSIQQQNKEEKLESEKELSSMRELMDSMKKIDILNFKNQILKLNQEKEDQKKQSEKDLSELKSKNNEIIDQFQRDSQKLSCQIQEIIKMQAYIEDLQNQISDLKKTIEMVKKECYERVKIVQNLYKDDQNQIGDKMEEENVKQSIDAQKQKIKDAISHGLQQVSDVDKLYGNSKSNLSEQQQACQIEISLLISQIVCEFSKLYEKQIVLEKKKASADFKKYSDQYQKQKLEISSLKESNKILSEDLKKNFIKQMDEASQNDSILIKKLNEQCENLSNDYQKLLQELQNNNFQLQDMQNQLQNSQNQINRQKKDLMDQKQLYEVRVQSQEQEIEQHQFRYRELEQRLTKDIQFQEERFLEVQNKFQMLQKSTKQAQIEKDAVMQEIKVMQQSVETVQKVDEEQRDQIKMLESKNMSLKQKIQQRENEMSEAVKSLKQFSDLKKIMDKDIEQLKFENEQLMGGHRNPNQKIQFHMKIKEENNKLREDNGKLQEELQKKIELIQKIQSSKDGTPSKQQDKFQQYFYQFLDHMLQLSQIQKIAQSQQLVFDFSNQSSSLSYQSIQQASELMNYVNQVLKDQQSYLSQNKEEPFDKFSQQSKSQTSSFKGGIPPRHNAQPFSSQNNQVLQSSKSSSILTQKHENYQQTQNSQNNNFDEYSNISRAQSISQINQIIYTNRGTSQKNVPFHSSSKKQIGQIPSQQSTSSFNINNEDLNKNVYSVSSSDQNQLNRKISSSGVIEQQRQNNGSKAVTQSFVPSTQINIQQLLRAGSSSSSSSKKLMQQSLSNLQQQQVQYQDNKSQKPSSQQKVQQQALAETVILNSYSNVHGKQINSSSQLEGSAQTSNRMKPQNENETLFQKFSMSKIDNHQLTGSMHQSGSKPQFNAMQQQQIVMMASGPVIVSTPTSSQGYSNINTKHKQYKQAQSQKGSLISQRSKSRANNQPTSSQNAQHSSSNQQNLQRQFQMNDLQ